MFLLLIVVRQSLAIYLSKAGLEFCSLGYLQTWSSPKFWDTCPTIPSCAIKYVITLIYTQQAPSEVIKDLPARSQPYGSMSKAQECVVSS